MQRPSTRGTSDFEVETPVTPTLGRRTGAVIAHLDSAARFAGHDAAKRTPSPGSRIWIRSGQQAAGLRPTLGSTACLERRRGNPSPRWCSRVQSSGPGQRVSARSAFQDHLCPEGAGTPGILALSPPVRASPRPRVRTAHARHRTKVCMSVGHPEHTA